MNLPNIGDYEISERVYTEEMVRQFSVLSGDYNPVHLDQQFAAKSIFKKNIVHGILIAGQISALLAEKLPGPGSIYLHQSLNFKSPVYWNDEIVAKVVVTHVKHEKSVIQLYTECKKKSGEIVIDGEAIIKKI